MTEIFMQLKNGACLPAARVDAILKNLKRLRERRPIHLFVLVRLAAGERRKVDWTIQECLHRDGFVDENGNPDPDVIAVITASIDLTDTEHVITLPFASRSA